MSERREQLKPEHVVCCVTAQLLRMEAIPLVILVLCLASIGGCASSQLQQETIALEPRVIAHQAQAYRYLNDAQLELSNTQSGSIERARTLLRLARELGGEFPQLLDAEGCAALRAGRWTDAERLFRSAVEQEETLADAHGHLGIALMLQGRDTAALGELSRAIALNPLDGEARNNRVVVLLRLLQQTSTPSPELERLFQGLAPAGERYSIVDYSPQGNMAVSRSSRHRNPGQRDRWRRYLLQLSAELQLAYATNPHRDVEQNQRLVGELLRKN